MQITADYKIETDERNITLLQRCKSKDETKETWKPVGYYPTHQAALRAMIQKEIRVPQEYQDVVCRIAELESVINGLVLDKV